jgi:hypothetical protein
MIWGFSGEAPRILRIVSAESDGSEHSGRHAGQKGGKANIECFELVDLVFQDFEEKTQESVDGRVGDALRGSSVEFMGKVEALLKEILPTDLKNVWQWFFAVSADNNKALEFLPIQTKPGLFSKQALAGVLHAKNRHGAVMWAYNLEHMQMRYGSTAMQRDIYDDMVTITRGLEVRASEMAGSLGCKAARGNMLLAHTAYVYMLQLKAKCEWTVEWLESFHRQNQASLNTTRPIVEVAHENDVLKMLAWCTEKATALFVGLYSEAHAFVDVLLHGLYSLRVLLDLFVVVSAEGIEDEVGCGSS